MPRGGRRSGKPGVAHGQRTDLNQPITHIPGQTYGAQAAQVRAQQSVPVGPTPTPTTPGMPLPPQGGVAGAPTGTTIIPLDAPTARPGEPVTAGAPTGPGPNSLTTTFLPSSPLTAVAAALASIPDDEQDSDTTRLLNLVRAQLGNQAAV